MSSPAPPFSYTFSHNVPELLKSLNISLAISTYQTGKVVIFSPKDDSSLVQLPRNFERPMGMAVRNNNIAIALKDQVIIAANAPGMAPNYPANPNTYDSLFIPRASFYTGVLDIHDLAWTNKGLITVNTSFSCLSSVSYQFSFEPIWKPKFITELYPEDRCHLNGIAVDNGTPRFVTALGAGNSKLSWKENMLKGGVLIDIESNEIILSELPVPHSPRCYEDGTYALLSAEGKVVKINPESGTYDEITQINGFLRGMDRIGDYLFVASSKLRESSSLFKDAPIAQSKTFCGISIIYIPTGNQVGFIQYQNTVDELFEVKVLPNTIRPNLLNLDKELHLTSVSTRDNVFWQEAQPQTS